MNAEEKLKLLSSQSLWNHVPEDKLSSLAKCLHAETYKPGDVIFEEDSVGDGLYFISSGHIRIRKKMALSDGNAARKELALLGPGECIGEMTLFEEAPRSAQASAVDDCILLKLERIELSRWLKSNPSMAVDFLTGLVQVLSQRLRHSSDELTLLFDISHWRLGSITTGQDLLQKCLHHLLPHIGETWAAGAYLYNEFNNEMDFVASEGNFALMPAHWTLPARHALNNVWLDPHTYYAPMPGKNRLTG